MLKLNGQSVACSGKVVVDVPWQLESEQTCGPSPFSPSNLRNFHSACETSFLGLVYLD